MDVIIMVMEGRRVDIQLGTNILRNTNGTFLAHGKEQLKVEDTTLKTIVMEIHKTENQTVNISAAKFYTSKGTLSEVSAEWWRVGNKMELTGIDTDLEGGGIELPE